MHHHHHKSRKTGGAGKGGRFLITVTVMGSAGPIRFLVNDGDRVEAVILTALRFYAREGRLPVLGSRTDDFLLFSAGSDELNPKGTITSTESRTFLLCKKQQLKMFPSPFLTDRVVDKPDNADSGSPPVMSRKRGGGFKSWINKSFNFRIASH